MKKLPTYLFVGPKEKTLEYAEQFLQKTFCKQKKESDKLNPDSFCPDCFCPDCFCIECRKIKQRQHHAIIWISPEKDYTIETVNIVFEKTRFALDDKQEFFFVLEKAHTLNRSAANRLLKVLEEPPAGYHFLLLTNNINSIMPTIISRSHIIRLSDDKQETVTNHPLLSFFLSPQLLNDPFAFEQALRKQKLTDSKSTQLANQLLQVFSQKIIDFYRQTPEPSSELSHEPSSGFIIERDYNEKVVSVLKKALRKPPLSGSSRLFWKNLFLHFPHK